MKKILIAFLCLVLFKIINNTVRLIKTKYFWNRYIDWLNDSDNTLYTYKQSIKNLFLHAGMQTLVVPNAAPVGYGQIATYNAEVSENMFIKRNDIVSLTLHLFANTFGVYRSRIIESFSPLYWINFIIFIPKHLLLYIGLDSEKTAYKLLNVVLSAIWWVILGVIAIFGNQLKQFGINFINQLLQQTGIFSN